MMQTFLGSASHQFNVSLSSAGKKNVLMLCYLGLTSTSNFQYSPSYVNNLLILFS